MKPMFDIDTIYKCFEFIKKKYGKNHTLNIEKKKDMVLFNKYKSDRNTYLVILDRDKHCSVHLDGSWFKIDPYLHLYIKAIKLIIFTNNLKKLFIELSRFGTYQIEIPVKENDNRFYKLMHYTRYILENTRIKRIYYSIDKKYKYIELNNDKNETFKIRVEFSFIRNYGDEIEFSNTQIRSIHDFTKKFNL